MNYKSAISGGEIELVNLLDLLWARKKRIILSVALGIASAFWAISNTQPVYESNALVQLEEKSSSMALPSSLASFMEDSPRSVTEIEIFLSRMVLSQVVADLKLDWRAEPVLAPIIGTTLSRYDVPILNSILPNRYARVGDSIKVEELIVPPVWLNQEILVMASGEDGFEIELPDGFRLKGVVGASLVLPDKGFSLRIADLPNTSGRQFIIRQIDETVAVQSLRDRLSIVEKARLSGILEIKLSGPDPERNTKILNKIVMAYVGQNIDRSAAEAESSLSFIDNQIPEAKHKLRAAEDALNHFQQQQVSIDLSLETQGILSKINQLQSELSTLQYREGELAQRYTPAHPTYRLLLDERALIEGQIEALQAQVAELPEIQRQIVNLKQEVELTQRVYTELQSRAQEIEVLKASRIGNARIVDSAVSSIDPIEPRSSIILMIGATLGLLAGMASVVISAVMRRGVRDIAEIEALSIPVLATINHSKAAASSSKRKKNASLVARQDSTDVVTEGIRSLRTGLHFGMLDASHPSLSITSAHPDAGKSFLSANLATVAAESGQKTCLIDADMRRGRLGRYFNVEKEHHGLSQILIGDHLAEDVIVPDLVPNLSFISSGSYPPNASVLLMRNQFRQLLDWCSQQFDFTIVDTPPILAVTDPAIIARETGATILVVRHDVTLPGEIEASQKTLAAAGVTVNWAVMNDFDPRKSADLNAKSYGYRYEYKQG